MPIRVGGEESFIALSDEVVSRLPKDYARPVDSGDEFDVWAHNGKRHLKLRLDTHSGRCVNWGDVGHLLRQPRANDGDGEGEVHLAASGLRKNYNGLKVDVELNKSHLDRLNSLEHVKVVSTCAGHEDRKRGQWNSGGGDNRPSFNIRLRDEHLTHHLKKALKSSDTEVKHTEWGHPGGDAHPSVQHLLRENGKPNEHVPNSKHLPAQQHTLHVHSKIEHTGHNQRELHDWWERTIGRLERAHAEYHGVKLSVELSDEVLHVKTYRRSDGTVVREHSRGHTARLVGSAPQVEGAPEHADTKWQIWQEQGNTGRWDTWRLKHPETGELAPGGTKTGPHEGYAGSKLTGYHQLGQGRAAPVYDRASSWTDKIEEVAKLVNNQAALKEAVEAAMAEEGWTLNKTCALVVTLIARHSFRVGSESSVTNVAKGKRDETGQPLPPQLEQTYGATTIRVEHVHVDGDYVTFEFTGKSAKSWAKVETDPDIAKLVQELASGKQPGDSLFTYEEGGHKFSVSDDDIRDFLRPFGFKPHRFRTYWASFLFYRTVLDAVQERGPAGTTKERQQLLREGLEAAAEKLNDLANTVKSYYVLPSLIEDVLEHGQILQQRIELRPLELAEPSDWWWLPREEEFHDWVRHELKFAGPHDLDDYADLGHNSQVPPVFEDSRDHPEFDPGDGETNLANEYGNTMSDLRRHGYTFRVGLPPVDPRSFDEHPELAHVRVGVGHKDSHHLWVTVKHKGNPIGQLLAVHDQVSNPGHWQVKRVDELPMEHRGKKLGLYLYAVAAGQLKRHGHVALHSDFNVSEEAGHVWHALSRRGYAVHDHSHPAHGKAHWQRPSEDESGEPAYVDVHSSGWHLPLHEHQPREIWLSETLQLEVWLSGFPPLGPHDHWVTLKPHGPESEDYVRVIIREHPDGSAHVVWAGHKGLVNLKLHAKRSEEAVKQAEQRKPVKELTPEERERHQALRQEREERVTNSKEQLGRAILQKLGVDGDPMELVRALDNKRLRHDREKTADELAEERAKRDDRVQRILNGDIPDDLPIEGLGTDVPIERALAEASVMDIIGEMPHQLRGVSDELKSAWNQARHDPQLMREIAGLRAQHSEELQQIKKETKVGEHRGTVKVLNQLAFYSDPNEAELALLSQAHERVFAQLHSRFWGEAHEVGQGARQFFSQGAGDALSALTKRLVKGYTVNPGVVELLGHEVVAAALAQAVEDKGGAGARRATASQVEQLIADRSAATVADALAQAEEADEERAKIRAESDCSMLTDAARVNALRNQTIRRTQALARAAGSLESAAAVAAFMRRGVDDEVTIDVGEKIFDIQKRLELAGLKEGEDYQLAQQDSSPIITIPKEKLPRLLEMTTREVKLNDELGRIKNHSAVPDEISVPGMRPDIRLKPQQIATILAVESPATDHKVFAKADVGIGKCLGKGTPVMMFDGTVKPVELIVVGDLLMGPDKKPRKVLSLARGRENLWRVNQSNGDPYVVNESHILSLLATPSRKGDTHKLINISVVDHVKMCERQRAYRRGTYGWKAAADFPVREEPRMDPYILGLWLGDGNSRSPEIYTTNQEIKDAVVEYGRKIGQKVRVEIQGPGPNLMTLRFIGFGDHKKHVFLSLLDSYELRHPKSHLGGRGKHIPEDYRLGSRETRLQLLAGLIDTDGSVTGTSVSITLKHEHIIRDLQFIARSLGFSASYKRVTKTATNSKTKPIGVYWQLYINGDTHLIPTLVPHKKPAIRKIKKHPLICRVSLESLGVGDYYGFEIDEDRLFMLGDFTVTHNTILSGAMVSRHIAKGGKPGWYILPTNLISTSLTELRDKFPGLTIEAAHTDLHDEAKTIEQRKQLYTRGQKPDILLIGQDTIRLDRNELLAAQESEEHAPGFIIGDEVQGMFTPGDGEQQSRRSMSMQELRAPVMLAMTGTPIRRSSNEVWRVLNWLKPGRYGSLSSWSLRYGKIGRGVSAFSDAIVQDFRHEIDDSTITEKDKPNVQLHDIVRPIDLSPEQKQAYRDIEEEYKRQSLNPKADRRKLSSAKVERQREVIYSGSASSNSLISQLHEDVGNHAETGMRGIIHVKSLKSVKAICDSYPKGTVIPYTGDDDVRRRAKIIAAINDGALITGARAAVIDDSDEGVVTHLTDTHATIRRDDGTTHQYKLGDLKSKVIAVCGTSTATGVLSTGLNLQRGANWSIEFSLADSAATRRQRVARTYRTGQTKDVTNYTYVPETPNTREHWQRLQDQQRLMDAFDDPEEYDEYEKLPRD